MSSHPLWKKEEQTEGKHLVLEYYLDGWFQILGSSHNRILYIDGFAGPGEYSGGDPGSPLIALECIRKHKTQHRLRHVEIICLFMESDIKHANHLKMILKEQEVIPNVGVRVHVGKFDNHMTEILDYLEEQKQSLAPSFVMIDPFGIKGNRMELIQRILANRRSECLISFMYEPIRRFHKQPEFETPLNALFGTKKWKKCLKIKDSNTKKQFLHELFKKQLKKYGAKYVTFFELLRGGRHVYTMYFATNHLKGCNLMKQALWMAEPSGSFAIRGYASQQNILFEPNMEPLVQQLKCRFGSSDTPIEEIDDFVMSDETIYHSGQLRKNTLTPLEKEGRITVTRPNNNRGFPAGKGITIRFH